MPDIEAIGRRDRRSDKGLGMADRGFQRLAFGKTGCMADDSEHPVPWVLRVAMRGAAARGCRWA